MSALHLAVAVLAAYRIARLVTQDTITDPLRRAIWRRVPICGYDGDGHAIPCPGVWLWFYELASCPLCVGVWASAGVYCAWRWAGDDVRAGLIVLAIAGGQAFLASR